ncbi:MAG: DUF3592 domain-containing protein [Planctomycetota bacterium]
MILFPAMGILIGGLSIWDLRRHHTIRDWEKCQSDLKLLRIDSRYGGRYVGTVWGVIGEFSYCVDGIEYESGQLWIVDELSSPAKALDAKEKLLDQIADQGFFTLYYNPENPEHASLNRRIHWGSWILLGISCLLVLTPLLLLLD